VSLTDDTPDCEVHHVVIRCRIRAEKDSESGTPFVEPRLTLVATCAQQWRSVMHHLSSCFQRARGLQAIPFLLPVPRAEIKAA
jgi:hypothetical protein